MIFEHRCKLGLCDQSQESDLSVDDVTGELKSLPGSAITKINQRVIYIERVRRIEY